MKRRYIILTLVLATALLAWLFWPIGKLAPQPSVKAEQTLPSQSSEPPAVNANKSNDARPPQLDSAKQDERRNFGVEMMKKAFGAQIDFFGKVVDEKGNPVPDADISYGLSDRPWQDGSRYEGKSDANGLFSITGIKGAALTVGVLKDGYYPIHKKSGQSFAYGVPPSAGVDSPVPTKETPAIFVLRKMGEAVPLLAKGARVKMPKDGSPMAVDLETGRAASGSQGDVVLECWTQNESLDPNLAEPYDWRFRLTVPGGGVVERTDQFAFEAPREGYRDVVEFAMPNDAERWKQDFEAEYFVKLGDGRYARVKFRITSGGAHFATVSSYLNPTPGSRNLEYDPAKTP